MKKTALTLLLAGIAVSAGAQTMYDAYNYSKSNYVGTARSVAMGNAFTALGGDLGAVSINPAGSAVARYSQVTLTPSVSISTNTATGTSSDWFEKNLRTSMTRFNMPNFGFIINYDTHRTRGLKNWSFGFVANRTDSYQDDMMASGSNFSTSLAGSLATFANGYNADDLLSDYAYDNIAPSDWKAIVALQSHLIALTPDESVNNQYMGVTENATATGSGEDLAYEIGLGGPVDQTFGRRSVGNKTDYVFNIGGNFSDILFLGANLGITSISYTHEWYIRESSQDPDMFETGFNTLRYNYSYRASGVGIYGKFGFILTPFAGLRLGAAIQTPSAINITENWQMSAEQNCYSTGNADTDYPSGSASSPEGEYTYELVSPFRFNVGAAYTFGSIALVSLDYEMCNYRSMRFRETNTNDNSAFDVTNTDIRNMMGVSHELRAGIEVKPIPALAIRAGYNYISSPIPADIEYENQYLWERSEGDTHSVSFGLGFSSKGSFFADLAAKGTKYPDRYVIPYDYYYLDGDMPAVDTSVAVPQIWSRRMLWNVLLTFGFRF